MTRVLVIDDSRSVLELISLILSEQGYEAVTSSDTLTVRQKLSSQHFDLIVTDIYMPGDDGLEVIRMRNKLCPKIPVLAISGRSGVHDMLPVARLMGATGTLHKPFSRADLISAVDAALGNGLIAEKV